MRETQEEIRIICPPMTVTGRQIYPVVRITSLSSDYAGILATNPVGLLIMEKSQWFFIPLDDEIGDMEIILEDIIKSQEPLS
ncbi:MAG: hypothetical protein GXY48_08920 [Methanomicrobiales archaeon]|nr:hypothetical protein [Methanomicrobiales archaeon]